jgi:hypothetical protein
LERRDISLAFLDVFHTGAYFFDNATEFVTKDIALGKLNYGSWSK